MSEKPRILIVEDERLVAEDLAELLTQAGYEIAGVAQTGMEAVDIARQAQPHLVLMDVLLEGDMDGIEAANLIHSQLDIPIVYLTAFADRDVLQRAKASQPFGYLVKPFSEKELLAVIEMALNKHELEIKLKTDKEFLRNANEELENRVRERTAHLLRLNEELEREVAERKKVEEALRLSEERYRTVADFTYDWEYWIDLDGNFLYVSPSCERITGYASDEFLNDPGLFEKIIHPDDLALVTAHWQEARNPESTTTYCFDFRIINRDGEVRWINHACQPVRGEGARPLGRRACNRDITDRKIVEQALIENEARYRALFENMRNGVVIYKAENGGEDFVIVDFNRAAEDIVGRPREEVIGRRILEVFPYVKKQGFLDVLLTTWRTGEPMYIPITRYRDDRVAKWVENFIFKLPSGDIVAVVTDETERKHSEDALRASEARYRVLIENAPVGILSIDKNGRILEVNSKLLEIMGSPSADATKAINMLDFTPLVDAGISDVFLRCMAEGTVQSSELPYTSRWGKASYLRIILTPLLDESGGVQGCQAVMEDVTDRRTAEGALRESEERFRSLFRNSLDAILLSVPDGRILMANPAASKMFGLTEEEILQGGKDGIVDTTDPRLNLALEERSRTGKFQGELNYKRKDGTVFPAEISSVLFRDAKGEWKSTIIIRDVASRKRLEEAQRRLAIAVEQAAEAIVITDTAGNIQYVNPGFERASGYTRDEALGKNPKLQKSGEHDRMFYENLWDTIKAGKVWTGRFTNKKKDGSIYHEDATISPVRDSDGKIINFVAVKRDITENLELSRQLLQAQKMEAIGTLAGGIAHDFNNLLQITLGYSELLLSEKREDDPEYADLSKILQSARSGAELVQRLLMFSRKVESKPIPTNLNAQIVQIENILRRTIPKVIEIRLDLSGDLLNILADPAQIEQVLMNLAVNARDAMPEGGRLTLGTRNVTLNEEFCKLRHGAEPGEYVLLTVSDTGHGMDEGTVEHIFEPFYTTKELGRGTGLGLSMVYGIVRQHDGYVTCYSEVGHGTTFNVYFPAIETPMEPEVEKSGEFEAFGTETILLVDDEEFVRDLGERILMRAGYTVLTAADGMQARDLFRKKKKRISLVILDLIMPTMGGRQCLEELLKTDRKVRVLIASGLSDAENRRELIEAGAKGFVGKPFRMSELTKTVRQALDSR